MKLTRVLIGGLLSAACAVLAQDTSGSDQFALYSRQPVDAAKVAETASSSTPRWLTLPKTPKLPHPFKQGRVERPDGTSIWYGTWDGQQDSARGRKRASSQPPLVFLHGGFASSLWLGNQIDHFRHTRNVISIDSRAQGRSTFNGTITYDLMTDDVVAVLDKLKVPAAAFVGWSDGAIIILDLMMRYPQRVDRGFAFAANYDINGTLDVTQSPVFTEYLQRSEKSYNSINPAANYTLLHDSIFTMWSSLPAWKEEDFTKTPEDVQKKIWIVDGDHEEAVKITQLYDMSRWMPDASALILPSVSHFAFMQDPKFFNRAIQDLLDVPL